MKLPRLFYYVKFLEDCLSPIVEDFKIDDLMLPVNLPEHLVLWNPKDIVRWMAYDLLYFSEHFIEEMAEGLSPREKGELTQVYERLTRGYASLFRLIPSSPSQGLRCEDMVTGKIMRLSYLQGEALRDKVFLSRVFPMGKLWVIQQNIEVLDMEQGKEALETFKNAMASILGDDPVERPDLKAYFPILLQSVYDIKNTTPVIRKDSEKLQMNDFLSFYFSPEDERIFRKFYPSFTRSFTSSERDSVWYSMHKFFINFLAPMGLNFSTVSPGILKISIVEGTKKGIFYQKRELLWLLIILKAWYEYLYIFTGNSFHREMFEMAATLKKSFFELLKLLRASYAGVYTDAGLMGKLKTCYSPMDGGVLEDFENLVLALDGLVLDDKKNREIFPLSLEMLKETLEVSFHKDEELGEKGLYYYANLLCFFALVKEFLIVGEEVDSTENFYSYLSLSQKDKLALWIQALFHTTFIEEMSERLPHPPRKLLIKSIFQKVMNLDEIPEKYFYLLHLLERFYLVAPYTSTRFALTEIGREVLSYYGYMPSEESEGEVIPFPRDSIHHR